MPYLNRLPVRAHTGELVMIPVVLSLTASTGAVTLVAAPPLVSVAKSGTGAYQITLADGPYAQYYGVQVTWSQAAGAIDANLDVMGAAPANGTGNVVTITTITCGATPVPVNVANACTVNVLILAKLNVVV